MTSDVLGKSQQLLDSGKSQLKTAKELGVSEIVIIEDIVELPKLSEIGALTVRTVSATLVRQ